MAHIKLRKLTVSGDNVKTSSIEFGDKLTIIIGPSNTGKTRIYKCLNYILGADNRQQNLPIDLEDGYDTIQLSLSTKKGDVVLTRKVKEETTNVVSDIKGIESGEYRIRKTKSNNKTINDLFLKLIGAPTELYLPKNNKGERARLTWRVLLNSFMVDEENSEKTDSILIPRHAPSLYQASLLYLITNQTFAEYINTTESEDIAKAKKSAVIQYIKEQRAALEQNKKSLSEQLEIQQNTKSYEEQINDLNEQLNKVNSSIDDAMLENKKLSKSLITLENRLARKMATIHRYDELKSQYETDVGRLIFIVESEILLSNKKENSNCPFCKNKINISEQKSYIEASKGELVKLTRNLNDLETSNFELQKQISDDSDKVEYYKNRLNEISNSLNQELVPQRKEIIDLVKSYEEKLRIELLLKNVQQYDSSFEEDLRKYEKHEQPNFKPFNAKLHLIEALKDPIEKHSKSILEKTGFPSLEKASFNEKTLDLEVNYKNKNYQGQGYITFFNSIMSLSLMKTITKQSIKNIGFYIYDSPLKSLKESKEVEHANSIRVGYFDYLVNLDTDNQIIVIENLDDNELPIIKPNDKIKVYNFTKIENKGRYGFFHSLRRV